MMLCIYSQHTLLCSSSSITGISLTLIIKHLNATLEQLDVKGCKNIDFMNKIPELKSMHRLRTLNYPYFNYTLDDRYGREMIGKMETAMPHVEFSGFDLNERKVYGKNILLFENLSDDDTSSLPKKILWEKYPSF